MGIYKRPDSKYYWMTLERTGGERTIQKSTRILIDGGTPSQTAINKKLAQEVYAAIMVERARDRFIAEHDVFRHNRMTPVRAPVHHSLDGWCYVYFASDGQAIKIGRAADVRKRLGTLQTAHGERLALLVAVPAHAALERAFQERFKDLQLRREWFRPEPELLAFIEALKTGVNPVALLWDGDAEPQSDPATPHESQAPKS